MMVLYSNFSESKRGSSSIGDVNKIGKTEAGVGTMAAFTGKLLTTTTGILFFVAFALGPATSCLVPKFGKGECAKPKKHLKLKDGVLGKAEIVEASCKEEIISRRVSDRKAAIWIAGRRRRIPRKICRVKKQESVRARYYRKKMKHKRKLTSNYKKNKGKDERCERGMPAASPQRDGRVLLFDITKHVIMDVTTFSSNNIDYGDIWDSPKGYPGEDHDGKKKRKLKKFEKKAIAKEQTEIRDEERKDNERKLIRLAKDVKGGYIGNAKEASAYRKTLVDSTEMIQNFEEEKIMGTLNLAEVDGKRIVGSIMALNARGMKVKMYDERGLGFYAFMK